MPRKSKKFKSPRRSLMNSEGGQFFRNPSATLDGMDPKDKLQYIQDIFSETYIQKDVISMLFHECACDVDQTVESIMKLTSEDNQEKLVANPDNVVQDNFTNTRYNFQEASAPLRDESFKNYIGELNYTESFTMPEHFYYGQQALGGLYAEENIPYQYAEQYNIVTPMSSIPPNHTMNFPIDRPAQQLCSSKYYKNCIPEFMSPFSSNTLSYTSSVKSPYKRKNSATDSKKSLSHSRAVDNGKKLPSAIQLAISKIKSGSKVLIILRGLPGSGKSTLAQKLKFSGVVLSTDDYFIKNGTYIFDWTRLTVAHIWNQMRTEKSMSANITPIIIDNTNTEVWEMIPYIKIGKRYSYEIHILEPNTPWKFKPKELSLRNKHGVPLSKIFQMLERYKHNVTVENLHNILCEELSSIGAMTEHSAKDSKEFSEENPVMHVSLEAVIHQMEDSDSSENEVSIESLKSDSNLSPEELISSADSLHSDMLVAENNNISETNTDLNASLTIKSLEELKSLVGVDSEESQSQSSEDVPSKSCIDIPQWIDITEPDDDFMWKIVLSQKELSPPVLMDTGDKKVMSDKSCVKSCLKNELSKNTDEAVLVSIDNTSSLGNVNDLNNTLGNLTLFHEETTSKNINSTKEVSDKKIGTIKSTLQNYSKSSSMDNLNLKNACTSKINIESSGSIIESPVKNADSILSCSLPKSFSFPNKSLFKNLEEQKTNKDEIEKNMPLNKPILKMKEETLTDWEAMNVNHKSNHCDSWVLCDAQNELSFSDYEQSFSEWTTDAISSTTQNSLSTQMFHPKPQRTNKTKNTISLDSQPESTQDTVFQDKYIKCEEFTEWESKNCEEMISSSLEDFDNSLGIKNYIPKPQRKLNENRNNDNGKSISTSSKNDVSETDVLAHQENKSENNLNCSENFKSSKKFSLFGNAFVPPLGKNWVFPEFKPDSVSEDQLMKLNHQNPVDKAIPVSINSSQTELEDFLELHAIESDLPHNEVHEGIFQMRKIMTSSSNILREESKHHMNFEKEEISIVRIPKFDKSTCTDDVEPQDDIMEKMHTIQQCFPAICEEDILHYLELCEGKDFELHSSLLYFGFEYNNPYYFENKARKKAQLKCSSAHSNFAPLVKNNDEINADKGLEKNNNEINADKDLEKNNNEINAGKDLGNNSNEITFDKCLFLLGPIGKTLYSEIPSSSENSFSRHECDSIKSKIDPVFSVSEILDPEISKENSFPIKEYSSNNLKTLPLILDTVFLHQLEKLFGRVVPGQSNSSLSTTQRTVEIDLELAELMHDKLKENVRMKSLLTNNDGNKKKQKKKKNKSRSRDITPPTQLDQTGDEPVPLSQIMDMELAIELHKKETLKKDPDSAKLERQKLHNLYPGADTIALDEIFESNNYSLKDSIMALGGDLEVPNTSQQKTATRKTEKHVAERSNSDVLNDLLEGEDWSYMVYSEGNVKSIKKTTFHSATSMISSDAQELREQAGLHYNQHQECIQKATNACGRGKNFYASYYYRRGNEHHQKFKECNKKASDLIFNQKNSNVSSSDVLDLHGLYVREAMSHVEKFLQDRKKWHENYHNSQTKTAYIVTGQGKHSVRGPKLLASVIGYLKKHGYSFSEVSSGVLEVTLCPE